MKVKLGTGEIPVGSTSTKSCSLITIILAVLFYILLIIEVYL